MSLPSPQLAAEEGRGAARGGLRFVAVFVALALVFEVAFAVFSSAPVGAFRAYLEWNADAAAFLLRALGHPAVSVGVDIHSETSVVSVRRGCDGVQATSLFVLAALAFPVSWRARLVGAAAGLAVLLPLNVVRVVTLCLCHVHLPRAFDALHQTLWPLAFVLVATAGWALWATRAVRSPAPPAPDGDARAPG